MTRITRIEPPLQQQKDWFFGNFRGRRREMPKGAEPNERQMPYGARCRTAPDAEPRMMPTGAPARDAEGRELPQGA